MPAQSQCGFVRVPEDPENPAARMIALRVAVVPALSPDPAPDPLVLLAGGPGQGAVEAIAPLLPAFSRVRRKRDLVLIDQRGTGGSNALECRLYDDDTPLAQRLQDEGFPDERLQECLKKWPAEVRQYTTPRSVEDLARVIEALGYSRVNLWGASYGTRLGLSFLREKPQLVRTAVLDGVAPYALRLPLSFARDGQRSLDLLFAHCAADTACNAAYPALEPRFRALLGRLGARPQPVRFAHPLTGETVQAAITRDAFVSALRGVLYAPELAVLVPWTIDRATEGDFGPFAAQALALEGGFSRSMSLGLFFSVVCTEDVPFITRDDVEEETRDTFFGSAQTKALIDVCSRWPRGTVPAGWREPVKSDTPVLLLSGELDPATPPAWAELASKTLPRSQHVVVPGVGHGATGQGCVPELVARFVEQGDGRTLETGCIGQSKRPPFFVSFAGPTP